MPSPTWGPPSSGRCDPPRRRGTAPAGATWSWSAARSTRWAPPAPPAGDWACSADGTAGGPAGRSRRRQLPSTARNDAGTGFRVGLPPVRAAHLPSPPCEEPHLRDVQARRRRARTGGRGRRPARAQGPQPGGRRAPPRRRGTRRAALRRAPGQVVLRRARELRDPLAGVRHGGRGARREHLPAGAEPGRRHPGRGCGARLHPRRLCHRHHREPGARQRRARVRRPRDRALVPAARLGRSPRDRNRGSLARGWGFVNLRRTAPACRAGRRTAIPMRDNFFSSLTGRDMAVDLGTANTVIYVRGKGMVGRTPSHIEAIRPLKDGVIADFEICEKMLSYFIRKAHQRRWGKPRMVICVPSGITGVEQRAVQEAAEYAGARKPAYIIEEPMAAAIGAGLPVQEPTGNMIVDIGGGTSEVAVISLGGIVTSQSIRVAGDEVDQAIVNFCKKEYSLALGERTAEDVKTQLASAWPLKEELYAEIRGRDLVSGLPKTIVVSTEEIREAIEEPVQAICDAIKYTLDRTPPALAADMMEKGIVITGGGSLLHGLDARIANETGMPVRRAENPLYTVVLGSGRG